MKKQNLGGRGPYCIGKNQWIGVDWSTVASLSTKWFIVIKARKLDGIMQLMVFWSIHQNPSKMFCSCSKIISKFMWQGKDTRVAKIISKKKWEEAWNEFQGLFYSHINENYAVLAEGETDISMKLNTKSIWKAFQWEKRKPFQQRVLEQLDIHKEK